MSRYKVRISVSVVIVDEPGRIASRLFVHYDPNIKKVYEIKIIAYKITFSLFVFNQYFFPLWIKK